MRSDTELHHLWVTTRKTSIVAFAVVLTQVCSLGASAAPVESMDSRPAPAEQSQPHSTVTKALQTLPLDLSVQLPAVDPNDQMAKPIGVATIRELDLAVPHPRRGSHVAHSFRPVKRGPSQGDVTRSETPADRTRSAE